MKLFAKLARLKHQKQTTQAEPRAGAPRGGHGPLFWGLLALWLVLVAGGTWVIVEFHIRYQLPPELVGKWEVEVGPQQGGTFEFYRDGTLVIQVTNRGK